MEGKEASSIWNFYSNFKVDSLKIAGMFSLIKIEAEAVVVFKNPMIAEILGARMYDGMCLYQSSLVV